MLNRNYHRALRSSRPLASSMSISILLRQPALPRRSFHPEPRSFQNSAHGTHRFVYRWIIQAIGTPFAVAYLCDQVSERKDDGGGGENSFKLALPGIDTGILTEPMRVKSWTWGQVRVS
ncbi:hypothetical protein G647_08597 [Cladophialophora carrionii CBS 160.54]|uniref:Uncharacterized protein n=1 Tax=Cladophialophora carrionii CBS 160.54 TaxID=1279043 RepID=V9D0Z8_9EURO|nr:uncharacterized protein G647_08597 [Cladophialophora carrionii CBS 160.54]ETI20560.1 hypothetical protein G647_08597 [Cladophialophora carrionii CBS 160.54]